jgi:ketosteroid isomerase-like protein
MRILLLATVIAGLLSAASPEDQVREAEQQWAVAGVKADAKALERLLSNDLVYVHSYGLIEGKAEYIQQVRSGARKYDSIDHEAMIVHVSGDTAIVSAKLHLRGANGSTPFDHFVLVMHTWIRRHSRWEMVGHQATALN